MNSTEESRLRNEILHDSAATLRQVAEVLSDLGEDGASGFGERVTKAVESVERSPERLPELIGALFAAHAALTAIADSLSDRREVLEGVARSYMDDADSSGQPTTDVSTTLGYSFAIVDEIEGRVRTVLETLNGSLSSLTHDEPSVDDSETDAPPASLPDRSGYPG